MIRDVEYNQITLCCKRVMTKYGNIAKYNNFYYKARFVSKMGQHKPLFQNSVKALLDSFKMVSCHLYHAGNFVLKITRLQINGKRGNTRLKRLSNYELRILKNTVTNVI